MNIKKLSIWLLALALMASQAGMAAEPDWSDYAKLLSHHVSPGTKNGVALNVVDYAALKTSGEIDKAAAQLAAFPLEKLANREEKLAFYINAYNILAMKMVLDHWPLESIKDVGSFFSPVWKKPAGQLDGKTVTLDALEHRILRPMGEPRIHFAIVCASVSCPDLRVEPYTAGRLDAQLDDQVRLFLGNSAKGLRIEQGGIRVSQIFDWFKQDFAESGGVEAFVRRYQPGLPEKLPLKANIPYDWSLNAKGN
ncbi:MAG: DUF547 domain-containing protein [Methylophilaceae bacterium]